MTILAQRTLSILAHSLRWIYNCKILESFTPKRFGKFFLIDLLGKGGMAGVYLATEIEKFDPFQPFKSFLALKQLFPKYSSQLGFIKCLVDEAKLTCMLKHPNIVEVIDLGNVGTDYYLTMNWVNGKSLYQLLNTVRTRNKVISKSFLFYIFQKVARGLHYAHEMKDSANRPLDMVHCDISPQNILIGYEGEVKLSDFGIATAEKTKEQASNEALLGKLPYMAPEQITLKGFDRRVDIYAFGVLMFEGLTGRKPLDAASIHELQGKIIREEPQFTSKIFTQYPRVQKFIEACLAKDPNNRPSSISDFFELENESEDVDTIKISKLMKLLFKDEIKIEMKNINNAVQILTAAQAQEDLLGEDEDENSFIQENSSIKQTVVVPKDAPQEMTKVALNKPERDKFGKIQIQKREVIRIIKKKPVEEEWANSETTQRKISKEMEAAAKTTKDEQGHGTKILDDVFDPEDSGVVDEVAQIERTVIDLDENKQKKWEEIQNNLRSNKPETVLESHLEKSADDDGLSESEKDFRDDFEPSYPKTGEIIEFTKTPGDENKISPEAETHEVNIQLKVVKKPKSELEKPTKGKMEFSHYFSKNLEKNEKPEEEYFQEISKSKNTKIDESNNISEARNVIPSGSTITFQIHKRTLATIILLVILGIGIGTSQIKNPFTLFNHTSITASDEVHVINFYISVEEIGNAQEKSSVALWMNSDFQQAFLSPIQAFFEREYLTYTKKQQLPFRFVFAGFERDTPKIQWQGGIFNSYLPFEEFFNIFQLKNQTDLKDQARLFIHLYSKQLNAPSEYPIDFQGGRLIHHGILYYPLFSETDSEFQLRLTHEILHMLGAKDLYNAKGLPKYPDGYAEPFKDPLHPQTYGEIMSRTIPQNPSEYIPLPSLEEARIGAATAHQLGWITEDEKNKFYRK